MPHRMKYMVVLLFCLIASGCRYRSNWAHPGPEFHQRQQAVLFDPYPDSDIAPEVLETRPREYSKGLPEVQRARIFRESWWGR